MKECLKRDMALFQVWVQQIKWIRPVSKLLIFQKHIRTRLQKSCERVYEKKGLRKGIPVVFSDESPIVIREDAQRSWK